MEESGEMLRSRPPVPLRVFFFTEFFGDLRMTLFTEVAELIEQSMEDQKHQPA
jgi:hypothetical protein